jgi:hypothetical protein
MATREYAVVKEHARPFSSNDISFILNPKANTKTSDFGRLCEKEIPDCRCYPFESLTEETDFLRWLVDKSPERIVFDTSSSRPEIDYEMARAVMGCRGLCTANKGPWADSDMCAELFREARDAETCLGLNCTTGVWVDQIDIVPLVMLGFRRGRIAITKRDNSSLNTFISKVGSGKSAESAFREVMNAGLLEPGAEGLDAEIHDQVLKAKIVTNVCLLLREAEWRFVDKTSELAVELKSENAEDIAEWHKAGRREGVYRTLISEIVLDTEIDESLRCEISFGELGKDNPLAKDFVRKNAILIESSPGTVFDWSKTHSSRKQSFMHAGYADAAEAASKLRWEAEAIIRMSRFKKRRKEFSPLPILLGLSQGDRMVTELKGEIVARLG